MRVVIADDESLVRASLKSMLEESEFSVQVVGQATDGQELVSLVEKFLPDIAFVDIKMPVLNGLEAIKAVKEISPCTQWIILTGFKEFDYAREALSLGVACYLLKPVSRKELEQTLKKTLDDIRFLYQTQNMVFESELLSIVDALSPLSDLSTEGILKKSKFQSALFVFDSSLDEGVKAQKHLEFCKAVRATIRGNLSSGTRIAFFTLPSGELALAGAWGFSRSMDGKHMIHRYVRKIEALAKLHCEDHFSITVVKCEESDSLEKLIKNLNQMHNLSVLRVIAGHGEILSINELSSYFKGCSPELLELCDALLRLSSAYTEKAYAQFIRILDELEMKIPLRKALPDTNVRKSVASFLIHSIGCDISLCQEPSAWLKNIRNFGETVLEKMRKDDSAAQDIMSQVLLYIEQNYSKDFGLAQIAEQFDVTPNYLSALFHKKTGVTFMNYMTRIRMVKAKELLSNPNTKVQKAAEQLGYCSARHFSRIFKKFYGCYPSDYLSSLHHN